MISKEITFTAFGLKHLVVAEIYRYENGNLGIRLWEIIPEGDKIPWDDLTMNIDGYPNVKPESNQAYIKIYSENEEWVNQVLDALEAKDTGIRTDSGYIRLPLYEFNLEKIFS